MVSRTERGSGEGVAEDKVTLPILSATGYPPPQVDGGGEQNWVPGGSLRACTGLEGRQQRAEMGRGGDGRVSLCLGELNEWFREAQRRDRDPGRGGQVSFLLPHRPTWGVKSTHRLSGDPGVRPARSSCRWAVLP